MPSPVWFLLTGIALALMGASDKIQKFAKKHSGNVLKFAVIVSGAKITFSDIVTYSSSGALLTAVSVTGVMVLGTALRRPFKVSNELGLLISSGTAICGGSAIAAVGPSIKANTENMGTSIAIVFVLNALGLLLFPTLGRYFLLSDEQFAYWAALAIHDTSSVVGAAAAWSSNALSTATTLKLTRALWIVPLALVLSNLQRNKAKVTVPWFILGFILMSALSSYGFAVPNAGLISQAGFSISLFLIGLSLSKKQIAHIGFKPFLYASLLWLITASASLMYVLTL